MSDLHSAYLTMAPSVMGESEGINLNPEAQDCHFYFYSTCSRGDSCQFRHCSAALGSEETCTMWRDAVCRRRVCAYRHATLERQRSAIQCYWETQPMGCLKEYCPFSHFKPRPHSTDYQVGVFDPMSVGVKSLDQIKGERERREGDQQLVGSDLRRELLRRMQVEQNALKEKGVGTREGEMPSRGEGALSDAQFPKNSGHHTSSQHLGKTGKPQAVSNDQLRRDPRAESTKQRPRGVDQSSASTGGSKQTLPVTANHQASIDKARPVLAQLLAQRLGLTNKPTPVSGEVLVAQHLADVYMPKPVPGGVAMAKHLAEVNQPQPFSTAAGHLTSPQPVSYGTATSAQLTGGVTQAKAYSDGVAVAKAYSDGVAMGQRLADSKKAQPQLSAAAQHVGLEFNHQLQSLSGVRGSAQQSTIQPTRGVSAEAISDTQPVSARRTQAQHYGDGSEYRPMSTREPVSGRGPDRGPLGPRSDRGLGPDRGPVLHRGLGSDRMPDRGAVDQRLADIEMAQRARALAHHVDQRRPPSNRHYSPLHPRDIDLPQSLSDEAGFRPDVNQPRQHPDQRSYEPHTQRPRDGNQHRPISEQDDYLLKSPGGVNQPLPYSPRHPADSDQPHAISDAEAYTSKHSRGVNQHRPLSDQRSSLSDGEGYPSVHAGGAGHPRPHPNRRNRPRRHPRNIKDRPCVDGEGYLSLHTGSVSQPRLHSERSPHSWNPRGANESRGNEPRAAPDMAARLDDNYKSPSVPEGRTSDQCYREAAAMARHLDNPPVPIEKGSDERRRKLEPPIPNEMSTAMARRLNKPYPVPDGRSSVQHNRNAISDERPAIMAQRLDKPYPGPDRRTSDQHSRNAMSDERSAAPRRFNQTRLASPMAQRLGGISQSEPGPCRIRSAQHGVDVDRSLVSTERTMREALAKRLGAIEKPSPPPPPSQEQDIAAVASRSTVASFARRVHVLQGDVTAGKSQPRKTGKHRVERNKDLAVVGPPPTEKASPILNDFTVKSLAELRAEKRTIVASTSDGGVEGAEVKLKRGSLGKVKVQRSGGKKPGARVQGKVQGSEGKKPGVKVQGKMKVQGSEGKKLGVRMQGKVKVQGSEEREPGVRVQETVKNVQGKRPGVRVKVPQGSEVKKPEFGVQEKVKVKLGVQRKEPEEERSMKGSVKLRGPEDLTKGSEEKLKLRSPEKIVMGLETRKLKLSGLEEKSEGKKLRLKEPEVEKGSEKQQLNSRGLEKIVRESKQVAEGTVRGLKELVKVAQEKPKLMRSEVKVQSADLDKKAELEKKKVTLVRRKMPRDSTPTTLAADNSKPRNTGPDSIPKPFHSGTGPGAKRSSGIEEEVALPAFKRQRLDKHKSDLSRLDSKAEESDERTSEDGVNPGTDAGQDRVNAEDVGGVSQERKMSITELRKEILADLQQYMEFQDDKDLLDEMALFIESGEEGNELDSQGGLAFSDSKDDDDLLLQMEEFM